MKINEVKIAIVSVNAQKYTDHMILIPNWAKYLPSVPHTMKSGRQPIAAKTIDSIRVVVKVLPRVLKGCLALTARARLNVTYSVIPRLPQTQSQLH